MVVASAAAHGPVASLNALAAGFQQCAEKAIAAAQQAAADAAEINDAHAKIVNQHRKLFLQKAFGINPDGTKITNLSLLPKKPVVYKSVRTVEQYNDMIRILTNWGDDAVLAAGPPDDPIVKQIKAFRTHNRHGYNYVRDFELEEIVGPDGFPKVLLIHKKSRGIVSHMLDIFDVIHEAHSRMGHLRTEKTLANCKPQFYSPTSALCKLFIDDCFVCHETQPEIPARKGAKKPILTSDFRDCIQVDLIDMRTMRKLDIYGQMQRWILTVKDHSTGLVYLAALPQKKAEFVAAELEKYFGFVGFPHILHSDNGKEFIASLVVDMIKRNNPDCFIVTGRPRTPRDQGSVEIANKLVKRVLMRVSSQRRLQGIDTNWTRILGHVMSVCNSHSGTRKYSTSSYEAVFGQKYHPALKCTVSEMRQCRTILQRLKLSPDERLETYVQDHGIVDPEDAFSSWEGGDGVNEEMDVEDETEGIDVFDDAFPEACVDDNGDDDDEFPDLSFYGAVDEATDNGFTIFGQSGDKSVLESNVSEDVFCEPCCGGRDGSPPAESSDLPVSGDGSPPAAASSTTTHSKTKSVFTLKEAWERGFSRPWSQSGDRQEYNFIWCTLTCVDCCCNRIFTVQVGDDSHIEYISTSQIWYDGIFMSSFAQLAAHYAHTTSGLLERCMPVAEVLPKLIHVTYPREDIEAAAIPPNITTVVGILHDKNHYAVLEINIIEKRINIYDGLYRDMDGWFMHVFAALKRCNLCPRTVNPNPVADEQVLVKRGRLPKMSIEGYTFDIGNDSWKYVRGNFIRQVDGFNCGPIACVKILEIFRLASKTDLVDAYDMGNLRQVVAKYWRQFLDECDGDLLLARTDRNPSTTTKSTDDEVVAATDAKESANTDDNDTSCFCYCDAPEMDLVRLECCRNTIHRKCLLAHITNYPQCPYCRNVLPDIAKVFALPSIDRNSILVNTTTSLESPDEELRLKHPPELIGTIHTPDNVIKTPSVKRNLQSMLVKQADEKTPLRLSDQLRTTSQEKKRSRQIEQAKRMVSLQGNEIASLGAAPGAVVVVQCPATAVSHAIGIMGVIYELSKHGGARVATVAGILSHGNRKMKWWIPSDQYVVKYRVGDEGNIPPELTRIREAIIAGNYNTNNSAPTCTIQQAHQVLTDATSPCKVSRCNCKNGKCTVGRCGCIRKRSKCSSACSCNGGCETNINNGK